LFVYNWRFFQSIDYGINCLFIFHRTKVGRRY
jgi:hypothetical protein